MLSLSPLGGRRCSKACFRSCPSAGEWEGSRLATARRQRWRVRGKKQMKKYGSDYFHYRVCAVTARSHYVCSVTSMPLQDSVQPEQTPSSVSRQVGVTSPKLALALETGGELTHEMLNLLTMSLKRKMGGGEMPKHSWEQWAVPVPERGAGEGVRRWVGLMGRGGV